MPSLKEIKIRIASVNSTKKITSAMKMVSSAKLHHAQGAIEHLLPYERRLSDILAHFPATEQETASPYTESRTVRRMAIVAFSSNSGLCGTFNTNIVREVLKRIRHYEAQQIQVCLYPVGKKVAEALRKEGYEADDAWQPLAAKPQYADVAALAEELMNRFVTGGIDGVELLYHHFKSTASQALMTKVWLPVGLPDRASSPENGSEAGDYLIEPSADILLGELLPKVLRMQLYAVLLDTVASEHAARVLAMQTASENANDLLQELTLQYNKSRQQAITNELLDIMGGR